MIKTRFAPSPTGYLHVGGLRTALYAYLFARQNNGKFILRIEDTDQERFVTGAMESLIRTLSIMGIEYDEGPYLESRTDQPDMVFLAGNRELSEGDLDQKNLSSIFEKGDLGPYIQSKRTEIYRKYAEKLLHSGHAYRCFCTKERLDQMREDQKTRKLNPMYDRKCAYLSDEEMEKNLEQKLSYVLRLKISHEKTIAFEDTIRGKVEFKGYIVDDQVLLKSDGFPTYHLANVVDDHLMEITHVIRGEEWLSSTPKHIALYEAFGWKAPIFAHLPLLLNPDKSKLSKRQGDVAVEDYLQKGYLVEALNNFVALLGWNPGTEEEMFNMEALIKNFDLNKVQKAGAVFDHDKLDWMNGKYIRMMNFDFLCVEVLKYLDKEEWFSGNQDDEYIREAIKSVYQKFKKLTDAPSMLKFYFLSEFDYNKNLFINEKMKIDEDIVKIALSSSIEVLENLSETDFKDEQKTKDILVELIEKLQLKNGQLLWPIRVALTNEEFSPGVFELMKVMGKAMTMKRLKGAVSMF